MYDRETDIFQPSDIIQHIMQAQREAVKFGIKANAVAISDKLYFSKFCHPGGDVPMICGLKCVYANDLPDDTLFAVFEAHNAPKTNDERIKELEAKNEELMEKIRMITELFIDII